MTTEVPPALQQRLSRLMVSCVGCRLMDLEAFKFFFLVFALDLDSELQHPQGRSYGR